MSTSYAIHSEVNTQVILWAVGKAVYRTAQAARWTAVQAMLWGVVAILWLYNHASLAVVAVKVTALATVLVAAVVLTAMYPAIVACVAIIAAYAIVTK